VVILDGHPGPRLLGRHRECESLDRLLADVRTGHSQVLVLRGEAGVGKTALLDYLLERSSGCRVARAAGVHGAAPAGAEKAAPVQVGPAQVGPAKTPAQAPEPALIRAAKFSSSLCSSEKPPFIKQDIKDEHWAKR